jgi:hypothetical protein
MPLLVIPHVHINVIRAGLGVVGSIVLVRIIAADLCRMVWGPGRLTSSGPFSTSRYMHIVWFLRQKSASYSCVLPL